MNDNQQVLNLLNQANTIPAPIISRRTFCLFASTSFISILLPGCNLSKTRLQELSQEIEFKNFFDVIFPASSLGLNKYSDNAFSRIQQLSGKHALVISKVYLQFKNRLLVKSEQGTKGYNRAMGEACLIDLMHSKHADQCNFALDIIYYTISKDNKLITALWGRKFSLNDRKCVYWDNYDQAIS